MCDIPRAISYHTNLEVLKLVSVNLNQRFFEGISEIIQMTRIKKLVIDGCPSTPVSHLTMDKLSKAFAESVTLQHFEFFCLKSRLENFYLALKGLK
jgi:hypothetical protein